MEQEETLTSKAVELVNNERQDKYGDPWRNHLRIANAWQAIFDAHVSPEQVVQAMIALKVARQTQSPDFEDHMVDIHGYTNVMEAVVRRRKELEAAIRRGESVGELDFAEVARPASSEAPSTPGEEAGPTQATWEERQSIKHKAAASIGLRLPAEILTGIPLAGLPMEAKGWSGPDLEGYLQTAERLATVAQLIPKPNPQTKLVYISGPMRGYLADNVAAFHLAQIELFVCEGLFAFNPALYPGPPDWGFSDYMRQDIRVILDRCSHILLLPGWEASEGATTEMKVAKALDLKRYETILNDVDVRPGEKFWTGFVIKEG